MALDEGGAEGAEGYKPPKKKRKSRSAAPRSVESPGSSSRVTRPRAIDRFENIHVNKGINWKKVDPKIIVKLNRLGQQTGRTITLTSGFRTGQEQKTLYNQIKPLGGVVAAPGTSPHEFGHAVDALVGGRAIGDVFTPEELASVGLKSLASIGDAVHIERLRGGGYAADPVAGAPVSGGGFPATVVHSDDPTPYQDLVAPAPVGIGPVGQPMNPYGDISVWDDPRVKRAQTWATIASLPGASPETQTLAALAQAAVPAVTQATPAPHSTRLLEQQVLAS